MKYLVIDRLKINKIDFQALLPLVLLAAMLISVAIGLSDVVRELEPWLLLFVALLGLLFGWGLAGRRLSAWLGGPILVSLGILIVLSRVGRLGSALFMLLASIATGIRLSVVSLWRTNTNVIEPTIAESINAMGVIWADTITILTRVQTWGFTLSQGQAAFDPVASAFIWAMAIWLVSTWAGWLGQRHSQPLITITPAGILLAASLFFANAKPWGLLAFLGVTLIWLSVKQAVELESLAVRPSFDITGERLLTSTVLSLTLVATAALVPSISVEQVVAFVNRLTDQPANQERHFANSLGLLNRGQPQTAIDRARVPGLPQTQLIGSGPELSEQVVMIVQVTDEQGREVHHTANDIEVPRFYWRSLSYERYTGRGWWTGTPKREDQLGGQSIDQPRFSNQRSYIQSIQTITKTGRLVYAAGALSRVEQDYTVAWRSRSDLQGIGDIDQVNDLFGATIEATSFQVESRLPVVSIDELREAGGVYPDWISQRYLALPEEVPPRVLGLARDLTATERTPYDRALVIETFLRTIPYSLNLPEPPSDQDLVDYFLFDLKQGYCDYYASAMVVLARAAGVPARLVVGFIGGTFDEANNRYVVTAADAHSWVEVYFPGHGWVEFDPTARLSPIERPIERDQAAIIAQADASLTPARTDAPTQWFSGWLPWSVGLILLLCAFVAWLAIDAWYLARRSPSAAIATIFGRLCGHGRRLNVSVELGDTPNEFATHLLQHLKQRSDSHQYKQQCDDLTQLTNIFNRSQFSPHPASTEERTVAIKAWRRLSRDLWTIFWNRFWRV